MVQVGAYQQTAGYYNHTADKAGKQQANRSAQAERKQTAGYVDKAKEQTLSQKAQDVLKQLREKYGNMDFMVADFKNADEAKAALSKGTKEFSVLFSSEELEKMASDEKYLNEKMRGIKGAVRMSEEINQKYGFERAFGKEGTADTAITKIGIAFNDDGTTSFFAELEKSSAKQRERIEKAREEKRAGKELQNYVKSTDAKRTDVQADSIEELIEKISAVNWDKIKTEQTSEYGRKFDYSI